jgi:hypothetical protein
MKRILLSMTAALALGIMGWVSAAHATVMVYRSVAELQQMSDAVVRGTIVSGHTYWREDGSLLTDWTVSVQEVLAGQAPETITVQQFGGEIDGIRAHIPGDAAFVVGQQVVLFLRDGIGENVGFHYLTAMGQAVLTVSVTGVPGVETPGGVVSMGDQVMVSPLDAVLVRDISDMVFYRPGEAGDAFYHLEAELLTLGELRALIADGVSAGGER